MQKTMETLAHAVAGLFLFTLFFLHLSPGQLMAQGSQGWGINQAVAKMKSFVNTLPPGKNRSNAEKAIKRIEEGLKNKDKDGNPDPRVIDGSDWFVKHFIPGVKAHTSPDDEKSKTSKPKWGKDEVTRVNQDLFVFIRKKWIDPCSQASQQEKDDWMNFFEGIVLIHEGLHVDQVDVNNVNRKKNECEAWKLTFNLMADVPLPLDFCLRTEWIKRTLAATRAIQKLCN